MTGRRVRPLATSAVMVLAVVATACSSPVEEAEVPVVVAQPTPAPPELARPSPSPSPRPTPSSSAAPVPDDDEQAGGPTASDAAAFVSTAGEGLSGVEHVVADVDGDDVAEVVATGLRDRTGVLRIAWWQDDAYAILAEDEGGRGRSIADLRAADVNRDGIIEVLVAVEGEGLRSLSLWAVPGPGGLERLEAVGGCHDGRHVYGVTEARLESRGAAPPVIVADCDESPLPVADWADQRWAWSDGAYRHEPSGPGPGDDDGNGNGGNGNGRGNGGNGNGGGNGGGNGNGGGQGG